MYISEIIISVLILLPMVGCSTDISFQRKKVSPIDASYRWKKISSLDHSRSPSVLFYQNILSKTFYSECKYFPSDSRYSQYLGTHCPSFKNPAKIAARFMNEYDADQLGLPLVQHTQHPLFEDYKDACTSTFQ